MDVKVQREVEKEIEGKEEAQLLTKTKISSAENI